MPPLALDEMAGTAAAQLALVRQETGTAISITRQRQERVHIHLRPERAFTQRVGFEPFIDVAHGRFRRSPGNLERMTA